MRFCAEAVEILQSRFEKSAAACLIFIIYRSQIGRTVPHPPPRAATNM